MEREFHPLADLFPLADGKSLTELAEDIRQNGLQESIVLYQDKILDGRNRYNACVLSGTEPRYTTIANYQSGAAQEPTEEQALRWLVAKNLAERDPTKPQRAVVAVDVLFKIKPNRPFYTKEDLQDVADLVGAGRTSVERLVAIQKRNPAVVDRVRTGALSIAQASRDAGFDEYNVDVALPGVTEAFGRGDKFREATEPLIRYLNGWRGRNFEFRHVNYREANQRLKVIEKLEEGLAEAKEDLERRAVKPTLSL